MRLLAQSMRDFPQLAGGESLHPECFPRAPVWHRGCTSTTFREVSMTSRILIAALALGGTFVFAETKPQPGVEVQMILTAADHMNHQPGILKPADITITDATITDWIPLDSRNLELFFVIDDSANYDFGARLEELKRFATAQMPAVSIGVAYIHDGALEIAESPTTDHARAVKAMRTPSGSKVANPYCALSDLIGNWQTKSLRREVVLVSAGIDDTATGAAVCVNAETVIHDAERAGVVVYSVYNPSAGYLSEPWSKVDMGIVNLASLSCETGGEAYFAGHTPTPSIAPFLADITEHLGHQYLVKFRLMPTAESAFETVLADPGTPERELMRPERVWVPGLSE
jgi:hypothetical protein